jgi:anti-anti-sigma factor
MALSPLHPSLRVEATGDRAVVRLADPDLRGGSLRGVGGHLVRLARESGTRRVDLDLGAVRFPTAGGLGELVALHTALRAGGCRLTLSRVDPGVREALAATRLDSLLEVRPGDANPFPRPGGTARAW